VSALHHGNVSGVAAVLALVAAALFAVATVAQQRSAATVPDETARGLGLIRTLVRRRLWWLGMIGDAGGYVAQAAALGFGSLLLVQPLLVTTLLFALPLAARWAGRTPTRSDWLWAVLLAGALVGFVLAGNPTEGVDRAGARDWLPSAAVLAGLLAASLAVAGRSRGVIRAVLLAAGTALCYGVAAALTKGVVGQFDEGPVAVLTSWETYMLAAVSAGGTLLQQSAFQAGALTASLPTMIVGEPVVAVVLGVAVLQEQLRADGAEWVLIGALVVLMGTATTMLARSSARTAPGAARS
jgi:drug/metabolite transporter (DMT)-like permease